MADDEIVQVERSGKRQKVRKKGGVGREGTMVSNGTTSNGSSKGSKDRHSKVRTSRGLRDRRVRLSPTCALRLFDIQDRLGFDQPSKAVDWLLDKAQRAIHQLPAAPAPALALAPAPPTLLGLSNPAPLGLSDLEQPPHPKPDPAAPPQDSGYDTLSLSLSSSSAPPADPASNAPLSLSSLNRSNSRSAPRHDIKEESLPISRCDHHHHIRPASPGHLRALSASLAL